MDHPWRRNMEQIYAIVTVPESSMYAEPGSAQEPGTGELTDELLSGWALSVLKTKDGWSYIRTFYGYEGWIRESDLRIISRTELEMRQDKSRFFRIGARSADLHAVPTVQGNIRETLLQSSLVEYLDSREDWSFVRSTSGAAGWIPDSALKTRKDDDGFLLEEETAGDPGSSWFLRRAKSVLTAEGEERLRERAAESALSYLGCSYRWGGKSPLGIDCSGLVFMSWMEQGILIYRDALIKPEYPVRKIERKELKKGDLIFFPGHVGMFLQENRFVHATGHAASFCVRINSLDQNDPDYRADLAENITMCGSVLSPYKD